MNLRIIGGRANPFKDVNVDEPKENPALEQDEEEEWGFPYRFNYRYIYIVEHIYDLINDDGDYEQAREMFQTNNIGTIFREDYQRLQRDLDNGMDLDEDEEEFIKELRERVSGIVGELRRHFGKFRGGKIYDDPNIKREDATAILEKLYEDYHDDMRKINDLLGDAMDEIHFKQNFAKARSNLKEVTRIMEGWTAASLNHGVSFEIPHYFIAEYNNMIEFLTHVEMNPRNRDDDSEDIQFNDEDWENMGAGFSRERDTTSNIRNVGGAIPERITDTLSSPHLEIRKLIRFMTRLVDYITELVDEPQTEQVISNTRQASRKLNEALEYFDKHYSDIATERYLNDEGLMEDYNNIVAQAVEANNFLNLDYGSDERKTT
nr:MAG: hypothetical protein [Lake Baikal virophage 14]